MTIKESHKKAKESIWIALNRFRGRTSVGYDSLNIVLVMLIYAKYLPNSNNGIIGFFDVIKTLSPISAFGEIIEELSILTGLKINYLYDSEDILKAKNNSDPHSLMETIDNLRADLLPAAKLLANGKHEDIDQIVEYIQGLNTTMWGKAGSPSINDAFLEISSKFFDYTTKKDYEINSLFPLGSTSAYYFAKRRNVYLHSNSPFQEIFDKGLISLYGKPFKFLDSFENREVTFAGPPFGIKENRPFSITDWAPFDEDTESKLIKDIHSKLIYLSHLNTKNTTIAITNLGTLWATSNGINYFRKIIIENNWLDAIIKLPSMVFSGTAMPGAMLVLKKERKLEDKVQFIDFSECKKDEAKRGILLIPKDEKDLLFNILTKRESSPISELVSNEKIRSNDYDLNFNKYIISREDKKMIEILDRRDTLTLDSLVNFIRPIPITLKKNIDDASSEINEVIISDINLDGEISATTKSTKVSKKFFSKSNLPFVQKDDLIISIKGTLGKIGYIVDNLKNTVPGTSLCILRPRDKSPIKGGYIFQYLRSELGQKMIFNSGRGDSIPFISINDLKNLAIPIPTQEEKEAAWIMAKEAKENLIIARMHKSGLEQKIKNGWLLPETIDYEPTFTNEEDYLVKIDIDDFSTRNIYKDEMSKEDDSS